ncbi:MAG: DUF1080 domain-containing protein [Bacteroidaceae bacterium]|nr:DUF1080 domain-containing protein [Bacteroidaceae bacterium]
MKRILCLAFFTLLSVADILAAQPTKSISLFNGKDLHQWMAWTKADGRTSHPETVFEVSEGMIRLHGKNNGGYLMTKKSYDNFHLSLDYRWNINPLFVPQKEKRNSGVMFRVDRHAPDSWFPRGIQYQIKTGTTGDFILIKGVTMNIGDKCYGPGESVLVARMKDATRPTGEWNHLEIIAHNRHITFILNGVTVNEGTNCSATKGRILLCYETSPIDFKNLILIK